VLDIADSLGNPLVTGIPLSDWNRFARAIWILNFGGQLYCTKRVLDTDAVPTYVNLGTDGKSVLRDDAIDHHWYQTDFRQAYRSSSD